MRKTSGTMPQEKTKSPAITAPARRGGLRAMAAILPKAAGRAFGRRGFADGDLVTRWDAIVGHEIAAHCLPLRLARAKAGKAGGTLTLRVEAGFGLELQHLEPLLIERINAYFGYRAVTAISLRQGSIGRAPVRRAKGPPPLPAEVEADLGRRLTRIEDDELREALRRLSRSFHARQAG